MVCEKTLWILPLMTSWGLLLTGCPEPKESPDLAAEIEALRADIAVLHEAAAVKDAEIAALEGRVAATEGEVEGLQSQMSTANELLAYVDVDPSVDAVRFVGANVYVQNGSGITDDGGSYTGRGNLIVGYDEDDGDDVKSGSHNLIVGMNHTYSSYGGLVNGQNNAITGRAASVLGGINNEASGDGSVIAGGYQGTATGLYAAVLGGQYNVASGVASVVTGGVYDHALGDNSWVGGRYGISVSAVNGTASIVFDRIAEGVYQNTLDHDLGAHYGTMSGTINTSSRTFLVSARMFGDEWDGVSGLWAVTLAGETGLTVSTLHEATVGTDPALEITRPSVDALRFSTNNAGQIKSIDIALLPEM